MEGMQEEREALNNEILKVLVGMVQDEKLKVEERLKAAKRFDDLNISYLQHDTINKGIDTADRAHNKLNRDMKKLRGQE